MVVLYESDITDLVSILQDTEENLTVEFERGDTIYETLDELRGHQGEVLHDFKLTVKTNDEISRPRASVSFESDYVGLSCNGPAQELPFRQAIDFLKARRRWMAKVPDSLWFFMGLLFPPAAVTWRRRSSSWSRLASILLWLPPSLG